MGRETIARLLSNRARSRLSSTKNAPREVRGDGDGGGGGGGVGTSLGVFRHGLVFYAGGPQPRQENRHQARRPRFAPG